MTSPFTKTGKTSSWPLLAKSFAALSLTTLAASIPASAQDHDRDADIHFYPGNLVVSRSVYDNNPNNVKVGALLPPNCANTTVPCVAATNDGTFPFVFNNVLADGSFGITSKVYLDQITPFGFLLDSLEVPNSSQRNIRSESNQLVTSFSSKSEEALNLSTDGKLLTFVDYVAPVNTIDVSNSNTPGVIDPTNPVGVAYYRAVATVNRSGKFTFTETNAYSGNNGRAAIFNNTNGASFFYTSGNAGNGSNPQPNGVILGAGAQIIDPANAPESFQNPGTPTPVASFSVTLLGDKADKIGKDDNFRGLTVFNNVLYYTKGSGGNGVNTVYFVDTTGTACPNGVGVPSVGATLPISPLAYDPTKLQTSGLPSNMCILAGFPTALAKTANPLAFPFGIWFANADTLYVADEGDGFASDTTLYTHAAAQTTAGIQKWIFNSSTKTWNRAYTLQTGLELGVPYTVNRYPTGNNSATSLPWSPATDGVRNLTGRVSDDGKVTLYAITSTVSGSGDQGADPNRLVAVTDDLSNTDAAKVAKEKFTILRKADFAEVLRGVSFTPGTRPDHDRW
ncbi:hypothetical protein [Tunturiibacter gelidoferens]|uniref:Uncharacterized protein n=1 Tax=Tunturiibacter gelidiferens TaxID=3069689 RepID=A0ACC5NU61_9BACT|nr:hypothetical protein [Edaphobacter lichenicola]MBB5338080.1 hypothetical protein [Edaphobacter lichenicola]